MRLDYLRYFNHLAKVLNFTKAAEDLFVAQPTLSVAIKRMEQELGVKLFKRGKGSSRIELTESGEAYFEYVSLALNILIRVFVLLVKSKERPTRLCAWELFTLCRG